MNFDVSLKAWISLSLVRGLGSSSARKLLSEYGSPESILSASAIALSHLVPAEVAASIQAGHSEEELRPTLDWLSDTDNHIVTLGDSNYPVALYNIPDPPILLYVKGRLDLLNRASFAIVGSRNATAQGLRNAGSFAGALGESGLSIISGLAHGIDAAAHQGSLHTRSSTIAVVGTGLDKVYPSANRTLAHEIAKSGCLISEFPLGTPPLPANFPRRNRLISGLSLGCLVVEASLQSGSLITARLAIEQNRDVFAIPGSIHSPQSRGCHALIKQGAKLVDCSQDILDELNFVPSSRPLMDTDNSNADIPVVLSKLGFDPIDLETLRTLTGLTVGELSAMLLTLELSGQVACLPGGLYQRLH